MHPHLAWPWLFLIILPPVVAAGLLGLLSLSGARSRDGVPRPILSTVAILGPALAFAAAVWAMVALAGHQAVATVAVIEVLQGEDLPQRQLREAAQPALVQTLWTWFEAGGLKIRLGLLGDALSLFMAVMVTGISTLITWYSTGYLAHDRGLGRFLALVNLFVGMMLILVLADSLPLTFLGWEGVGVCSWLLIGFWQHDPANTAAGRKAFIVNRVGDLGFVLGMALLVGLCGDLSYVGIRTWSLYHGPDQAGGALITATTLLLLVGATGKSAQIPLQTWLPDAMAGPTPVSALIHAATMVTAGVFLLARVSELFALAPTTMTVVVAMGLATALWAAIAALGQWDIKKVLAYSTLSQLGFMFVAAGLGAFDVAIFHVYTHAFFKAALFLGAGCVIHALHHEQDLRRMGGLAKATPTTHMAMCFAWWAILGLPVSAGFLSKDLILGTAFFHSMTVRVLVFIPLVATALLTAVYMTRLMTYAFWTPARHQGEPHEAPRTMTVPVMILGLGSLVAGLIWVPQIANGDLLADWLRPVLKYSQLRLSPGHEVSHWQEWVLAGFATFVAVIGLRLGWKCFRRGPRQRHLAGGPVRGFPAVWAALGDRLHDVVAVRPATALGVCLRRVLDGAVLPAAGTAMAGMVAWAGRGYRGLQRGRLRVGLALSLSGIVVVLWILLREVRP